MNVDSQSRLHPQLRKSKRQLLKWIEKWNCILCEFETCRLGGPWTDSHLDAGMAMMDARLESFQWYKGRLDRVQQSLLLLHRLRLAGDVFEEACVLVHDGRLKRYLRAKSRATEGFRCAFMIESDGRLLFLPSSLSESGQQHLHRSTTTSPKTFSVGNLPATFTVPIHCVASVWQEGALCCIRWLPDTWKPNLGFVVPLTDLSSPRGYITQLLLPSADMADECTQVIGTHLRHFNSKKLTVIQRLRLLAAWQTVPILMDRSLTDSLCHTDADNVEVDGINSTLEHRLVLLLCHHLLVRLWNAAFPDIPKSFDLKESATVFHDERWRWLGFQNGQPLSDVRATGLVGLWCLVYAVEKAAMARGHASQRYQDKQFGFGDSLCYGLVENGRSSLSQGMIDRSDLYSILPVYSEKKADFGWILDLATHHRYSHEENAASSYPWAAAGINMVAVLLDRFLGIGNGKSKDCTLSHPIWKSALCTFFAYLEPQFPTPSSCSTLGPGAGQGSDIKKSRSHADLGLWKEEAERDQEFDSVLREIENRHFWAVSYKNPISDRARRASLLAAPSTIQNARHSSISLTSRVEFPVFHFEEFFLFAMECLHRTWTARQATYMEFPFVMDHILSYILGLLSNCRPAEDMQLPFRSMVQSAMAASYMQSDERESTRQVRVIRLLQKKFEDFSISSVANTTWVQPTHMDDLWQSLLDKTL